MKNMPKAVEVKILELLNVCNEQNVSISGVVEVNNGNIINFSCINELHSTELNQIQTLNSVKGELIIGKSSGAVAILVSSVGTNQIDIVYLNENLFSVNETIIFQESQIQASVSFPFPGDIPNSSL